MENKTSIKINPEKGGVLKLKGLNKKQVELLKKGEMPLIMMVGLMGGLGLQKSFSKTLINDDVTDPVNNDVEDTNNVKEEVFDFDVPTNIEFSDAVTDNMNFSEAFKTARAETGPGGFFNWKGNTYNTLNKEEWEALSTEEKQDFFRKIQEHSDFNKSEINEDDNDIEIETSPLDPSDEDNSDEGEEKVGTDDAVEVDYSEDNDTISTDEIETVELDDDDADFEVQNISKEGDNEVSISETKDDHTNFEDKDTDNISNETDEIDKDYDSNSEEEFI